MTLRSHDQYNTTIYGLDDRYRGVKDGRKIIFMNMEDMEKYGLGELDKVNVHSYFNGPATGDYYREFDQRFNEIIDTLLAE